MGYSLHLAHLYGDLLNTYGDIGNVLVLEYYAKQMGIEFTSEIVSIEQDFDEKKFDLAFFGGGQDFVFPCLCPLQNDITERHINHFFAVFVFSKHKHLSNTCDVGLRWNRPLPATENLPLNPEPFH